MNAFKISKTVEVKTEDLLKQAGEDFAEVSTDNREIIEQFNFFFCTLFVFVIYCM